MAEGFDTPRVFVEDDDAEDDETEEALVCWGGSCGGLQRADGAAPVCVCVRGVKFSDPEELVCWGVC